ncbi:RagB/SusD family nutrient uptake outer membrane protein [Niabella defluvii]|nr:RagB/SusD family nutrient uptake outer membrane protein [Niabella sp. I65]
MNNNNSKIGYNFRKLIDPAYVATEWDGAQDFPIIRYAEVLLAYAEAKMKLVGQTQLSILL